MDDLIGTPKPGANEQTYTRVEAKVVQGKNSMWKIWLRYSNPDMPEWHKDELSTKQFYTEGQAQQAGFEVVHAIRERLENG